VGERGERAREKAKERGAALEIGPQLRSIANRTPETVPFQPPNTAGFSPSATRGSTQKARRPHPEASADPLEIMNHPEVLPS
jgi:hypothetical protein